MKDKAKTAMQVLFDIAKTNMLKTKGGTRLGWQAIVTKLTKGS